jgi:hypothetical protein
MASSWCSNAGRQTRVIHVANRETATAVVDAALVLSPHPHGTRWGTLRVRTPHAGRSLAPVRTCTAGLTRFSFDRVADAYPTPGGG